MNARHKDDLEYKMPFCLKQRPVSALGEFRSGVLCIRGGLINLEVRLSRRGYIGGEDVPFQVVIENNTGRKLHEAKVSLIQVSCLPDQTANMVIILN